jgi:hypothetical protein
MKVNTEKNSESNLINLPVLQLRHSEMILQSYKDAYMKEFWEIDRQKRTLHIRHVRLQGDHNNNKMERLNGEIRDREKVMRGLKKPDTSILTGYQLFHNYIRPHMGLDGKTPSEVAGIKVEGDNKWITLIQNASRREN